MGVKEEAKKEGVLISSIGGKGQGTGFGEKGMRGSEKFDRRETPILR